MPDPQDPGQGGLLVLGIHTAGPGCETALVQGDGQVFAVRIESMTSGQDARLPGLVAEMLAEANAGFPDVGRLAVVVGPGSFTGVRVGVAFARGLALAIGRPCFGVSSLEALTRLDEGRAGPGQGVCLGVSPAKVRPPDRSWWAQRLSAGVGVDEPVELDLEGARRAAGEVEGVWGEIEQATLGRPVFAARPSALGAARHVALRPVDQLRPPSPIYVREPDAAPMRRP